MSNLNNAHEGMDERAAFKAWFEQRFYYEYSVVSREGHLAREAFQAGAEWQARAALSSAPAQPVREPMWQPIETAPKDGTSVILFGDARWPAGVTPAHQDVIGAVGEGYFSGGFWQFMGMIGEPTHWMPLPAAPGITKE